MGDLRLGDYLVPTTVDWPGKCAMIIWFAGCNMRCPYCQNSGIIPRKSGKETRLGTLKKAIRENVTWIDGVVFSGGEPTLQEEALIELSSYIKENKRGVLVDTNGSSPEVLEVMLSRGLIDRISLDFKVAPERYPEVIGVPEKMVDKVLESLKLSLDSDAFLEVRTTVVPKLVGRKDIEAISPMIEGCDAYYIQQFRPEGDLLDESLASVEPPMPNDLFKLGRIAKKHVRKVGVKTREFGVQYL